MPRSTAALAALAAALLLAAAPRPAAAQSSAVPTAVCDYVYGYSNGIYGYYNCAITWTVTADAGQCVQLPMLLGYKYYTYDLSATGDNGAACNPTVALSKLYGQYTCINPRDLSENGCPVNSTSGTVTSSDLTEDSCATSNTGCLCNQVFAGAASTDVVTLANALGEDNYDSDNDPICAPTSQAFVFVQNTCDAASTMTIKLSFDAYNDTCDGGWATWKTVVIAVVCSLGVIAIIVGVVICMRSRNNS